MLFYKNDFGIKLPMKVDMSLKKETKQDNYTGRVLPSLTCKTIRTHVDLSNINQSQILFETVQALSQLVKDKTRNKNEFRGQKVEFPLFTYQVYSG